MSFCYTNNMAKRLLFLLRLYVTLLLLFVTQKLVFMLFNLPYAGGTTAGGWLGVLLHGLRLDSVTACYLMIVPVLVVTLSFFLYKIPVKRVLTFYYALAAPLMALAFAADMVLYRFWGAKMDAADLIYAANPADMLASLTLPAIIVGALLLGLLVFHYLRRLRHATPQGFDKVHPASSLVMLVVLALQFVGIRGGVSDSTANVSYAYFSSTPFLNHSAINPLFNITHSLFKTEDLAAQFPFYDDDRLADLTADAYPVDGTPSDTLLSVTRPDILLVIWEGAGSEMMLNDSVGPNFLRWKERGVFFSQCYANSFRTDRGLVSIVNGWPSLPTTSLMKKADMGRRLPSMARALQRAGYATAFLYGGDIDFTNMRGHLSESGFEQVVGQEYFSAARVRSNWGVADEELFRLLPTAPRHPSFTALLTLSSHEPWDVPEPGKTGGSRIKYTPLQDVRRNAFVYTDACLGSLLDSLSRTPSWDSLLVVVVADHGVPVDGLQPDGKHLATRIPILWVGGAVKQPRTIDRLMNQSDLAATLLAQLGLADSSFRFSRNVLAPSYRFPFAVNAYKNGLYYIDTTGVTAYDCLSLSETDAAYPSDTLRLQRTQALLQLWYTTTGRLR